MLYFLLIYTILGCGPKEIIPIETCTESPKTTTHLFSEIYQMATDSLQQFKTPITIEGTVISTDETGNIYGKIYLLENASKPEQSIQIHLDHYNLYQQFPIGSRLALQVNQWYYQKTKNGVEIGSKYTSPYGAMSTGRLPYSHYKNKISHLCNSNTEVSPLIISIPNISNNHLGSYIKIDSLQFPKSLLKNTFATDKETRFYLEYCNMEKAIQVSTSPYANFAKDSLPKGLGQIAGILEKQGDNYVLRIQKEEDIVLEHQRCNRPEPMSSPYFFFTELADPDNNSSARFIELYNTGSPLILDGWEIWRYTNAKLDPSSKFPLKGVLPSNKTLLITSNASEFKKVYGIEADFEAGKNSVADSNGDDNLVLIDPFGTIIDIFGKIGEDGSNTNHEFEDGKAMRLSTVTKGNSKFHPAEWLIYNDSGESGTIKKTQLAPNDFTPGDR